MKSKHSIVIRLINNPGSVIRIAMILERRSFSIESLYVKPVLDGYSEMELTITGDKERFEQVQKQLEKLVDVAFVEDKTRAERLNLHFAKTIKQPAIA